jgi:hypothetical protein
MKSTSNKVINLEWAVLCSSALLDKDTNNLSLINVIEGLKFEGIRSKESGVFNHEDGEAIPINLVFVARFRKLLKPEENISAVIEIEILDPKSKKMGGFSYEMNMNSGVKNFRLRTGINGLKVTTSGMYEFVVRAKTKHETKYKKLGTVPLDLELSIKSE